MTIKYASLNHINHRDSSIRDINITHSDSLKEYTDKLFKEITESPRKRQYIFSSSKSEVRNVLDDIVTDNDRKKSINLAAQRLLNKEKDAQQQLDNKKLKVDILKGSLFQAYVEIDGKENIIICKADHNEFLDENSLTIRSGLPWDKKIFKAALIHLKDGIVADEVDVLDANLSKYWWREFLELEAKHTDAFNTEKSMDFFDTRVFSGIKKKHPADYRILRNSFVGYYRRKDIFEIEDFIETLFSNYEPEDENLKIDPLVAKIRSLPSSLGFDRSFDISKKHIKKRMSTRVKVSDAIDLYLKTDVPHFRKTLRSGKTSSGQMYLQILTENEDVYKEFLRSEDE
ncbi:hypothetical protein JoomaDRAFT_3963 [Galbibacter orientalis DSM 19592]|uniref:37-kD nucleoid-associated bacterial protein n=1 Tax=Galbibacter orientalis DSM 19592 TaxID=926559 RepID=I3CB93_9FLAO|nr:hypothetical protein [Galbibacter orientalis]EIJ40886.1 hypothetical protein JoomaDRAFT_3963 [Galbibacter orientalis DSM 19592]